MKTVQKVLELTPEEWRVFQPWIASQEKKTQALSEKTGYHPQDLEAVAYFLAVDDMKHALEINEVMCHRVLEYAAIDLVDNHEVDADTILSIVDKYLKYVHPDVFPEKGAS